MSVEISISLSPESARFIAQLHIAPEHIQRALCRVIDEQNQLTIGDMTRLRLSRRSKTTLGVVTNRLRSSIRVSNTVVTSDGVQTSIGTNVVYAGAHEFGFNGNITVRSHSRTIKKIFGKRVAPRSQTVREHTRRMHLPERSFIRRTLYERAPAYTAAIGTAIARILTPDS